MDYEKNKEAIEMVRQMVTDGQVSQDVAEKCFPELVESEADRIRKDIIAYFKGKKGNAEQPILDSWIAWLEKQNKRDKRYKHLEELLEADTIYQMAMSDAMVEEAKLKAVNALSKLEVSKLLSKEWTINAATLKELIDFLENGTAKLQHDLTRYANWLKIHLTPIEKQGESDETKAKMFLINKGYPIDTNGVFPTYEEMYNIIREGLEKQGEQKSFARYKVGDTIYYDSFGRLVSFVIANIVEDGTNNPMYEDKDGNSVFQNDIVEQKSIDKVEPKFKVGDWIVDNVGNNLLVTEINPTYYTVDELNGRTYNYNMSTANRDCHIFTIQDAKKGDVLVDEDKHYGNSIFIYRNMLSNTVARCYVRLYNSSITTYEEDVTHGVSFAKVYPADQSQKETLFKAMTDAGYQWDVEKKELKKLVDKEQIKKNLQDNNFRRMFEQNPAWSEEDEKTFGYLEDIVNFCYCNQYVVNVQTCERVRQLVFRLKSLCFQSKWSKDDITRINEIIETLNIVQANRVRTQRMHYNKATIDKNIDWLKSFKERIQPKQEWKQENIDDLTDFENAMMHIGGSFFGQYVGLDPNDTNAIKEQANLLLKLVPNKEWSEEDESMRKLAINYLENTKDSCAAACRPHITVCINWLKSLRPQKLCGYNPYKATVESIAKMCDKYENLMWGETEANDFLREVSAKCREAAEYDKKYPQKQWKPSEEQIQELESLIRCWGESGTLSPYGNTMAYLTSLLRDLKQFKKQ